MSSENKTCAVCNGHGVLDKHVYYTTLNLSSQAYCKCPLGVKKFGEWCRSCEVQNAILRKRQSQVEKELRFSQIPAQWQEKTLGNLHGYDAIKVKLDVYLNTFLRNGMFSQGVYLWSEASRTGKTHTLIALCKEMIERYIVPCVFITEEEMYARVRRTFDDGDVLHESDVMFKFKDVTCLFIDDLGATKMTPWKLETLTSILNFRLMNHRPTFFSSNYSIEQYQRKIKGISDRPQRVPSRIREMTRGFVFNMSQV